MQDVTCEIDITSDICPMTFVRTRLALDRMTPGETLLVRLRGEEPLRNVPRTATEQEIIDFCVGQIASFRIPRYVRFVPDWPMSGTKIRKATLRERIAADLAARGITRAPKPPVAPKPKPVPSQAS